MRFWDSSAIVSLVAAEAKTEAAQALYAADLATVIWWATPVECLSALARLERDGAPRQLVAESIRRLDAFTASSLEIEPVEEIRETARRFLRVHPLRAADALQLAAAFAAAERRPRSLTLVTLDDRLRTAAEKEGFVVADI